MKNIPDIPDILKRMIEACPVKCTVAVTLDSDFLDCLKFWWYFRIKDKKLCCLFTMFFPDIYNVDYVYDSVEKVLKGWKIKLALIRGFHLKTLETRLKTLMLKRKIK